MGASEPFRKEANVKGYHLWTFMDNWSWSNAYKNRYGFVSVNLTKTANERLKKADTGFNRYQKITVFNQDTCSFLEKGKYFSYVTVNG